MLHAFQGQSTPSEPHEDPMLHAAVAPCWPAGWPSITPVQVLVQGVRQRCWHAMECRSSRDSRTREVWLDSVTRLDAASDFFGEQHVPRRALTMGVSTILQVCTCCRLHILHATDTRNIECINVQAVCAQVGDQGPLDALWTRRRVGMAQP